MEQKQKAESQAEAEQISILGSEVSDLKRKIETTIPHQKQGGCLVSDLSVSAFNLPLHVLLF